jgi:putative sterol carrier protein
VQPPARAPGVEVTPAQVLEQALPRALKTSFKQARSIGATYLVSLSGEKGGDWTIDLKKVEVRRGIPPQPDVILKMSAVDFMAMTRGRLDVAEATRAERIHIAGNPELIVNLGHLIAG